ncbi:MAG: DMT family transporter [Moraxellaceae bacterium]|nr:DMT family transporter [Moraxellaceae bacterium]
MSSRPALVGICLVLASAVLFSTKSIFIKLAYQEAVDPVTLLTLRMVFALPFFLVMGVVASQGAAATALTRRDWLILFALGFGGYYLASLLDFLGLQYISAGLERLVLFLYPTMTVLMTALLLRRPVTRLTWAAIAVSYVGMALVVWPDVHHGGEQLALGMTLVFGSALAYASYLVGSGEIIQRLGANRFTGITLSISCLCCVLHFLIVNPLSALAVSPRVLMLGVILAIVCTVLPATLLTNGIRRIGASRAALIGAVGPVATLWLGYAVLGEALVLLQVAGTALVLAGVMMVSLQTH